MPRRSPSPLDPDRLRALLAPVARVPVTEAGEGSRPGWVPQEPPDADTSWAADEEHAGELRPEAEVADGEQGRAVRRDVGRHRPAPRVLTVPLAFRGARLTVSWRAVVAVLALMLLAALVFAVRVARAEVAAVPEPIGPAGGLTGPTSVPGSTASSGAAMARGSPSVSETTRTPLVVDVVGQVARAGVVSVPAGARVADVLAAAGGPLPGADVQRLNLARLVSDGEQVFVPRPGETPPAPVGAVGAGGSGLAGAAGGGTGAGAAGSPGGVVVGQVNLNTATLAELDTLPGVGPVLAQRILDWRAAHGRFSSVDELGEVSGIGDKVMAQIRPKVRVG